MSMGADMGSLFSTGEKPCPSPVRWTFLDACLGSRGKPGRWRRMSDMIARNERRARRRAGTETGSAPSRTGSYRHLVNPFTPLRVFSDDQIEAMHQMALRILEELGMRVLLP